MSVEFDKIYAPHPTPTRGIGFFLGYNEKVNRVSYCFDNLIVQRGLTNLMDCEIYNQHAAKTTMATYSPNGRYIASADEDGNLRIWTPQNKDKTLSIETRPIAGPIADMSWTEDSERLAVIGKGAKSYGCVINANTGSQLGEVMGHTQAVRSCALRVQRPFRLVTAGDDCQHVFYKGPPFKFDHSANHHEKFISCVRYAPNGSVYATVGLDGKICVYDGPTGEHKATHQMTCGISACAFSPDSTQVLLAMMDGRSVIVNIEDGAIAKEWKIGDAVYQQQTGCLWTKTEKMTVSLNGDFNFLLDDGSIKIDRGHTTQVTATTPIEGGFVSGEACGRVLFWKYNELPHAVYAPEGGKPPVCGMCTMQDGKVAVSHADGVITIFDPADGSVLKQITVGKKGSGELVTFGNVLATYIEKNFIIIAGDDVKTIPLAFVPTAIAISVDGQEIAVGGADKLIHLFDVEGNEKGTIAGLFKECCAIAYSPDGEKIAASSQNKEIIVWNRDNTAEPVHDGWRFHSLAITKILWLDDNKGLITVSKDRSIRLWSLQKKRKYVEVARAHDQQISDAFWVDKDMILTVGLDGAARTWKVTPIE